MSDKARELIESAIADLGFARNRVDRIEGNGRRPDNWKRQQALERLGDADGKLGAALDAIGEHPGTGEDVIDLGAAVIAGNSAGDIAEWPIVGSTLSVQVTPGSVCVDHEMLGQWPAPGIAEGNPWVGAVIEGILHFGTYEWLRPGQVCKGLGVPEESPRVSKAIGAHVKHGPLASWIPEPGETVYFFVSALARGDSRTVRERTNVVAIEWPEGA